MVSLACTRRAHFFQAAALALLVLKADAGPLEANPVTLIGVEAVLTKSNPVFGGRPARNMTKPVVLVEDPTLSRAEVRDFVANNFTFMHSSSDGSGVGNGVVRAPQRKLESSSTDLERLETYFQQPMELNFNTIQQKYPKNEFKPAPWPSSYWPTFQDGINAQWRGNEPSPAEKYARAFGLDVKTFMDTVSKTTGIDSQAPYSRSCTSSDDCASLNDGSTCAKRAGALSGYCIATWYGICHAWAPAAISEPEPVCDVVRNGVTFHPFDIKALITQAYDGAGISVVFTGARYDGSGSPVDEYGRYTDPAERDLGPGFFHIAVTNIMGRFDQSFVVDVNSDAQVWNQPVRGYEIVEAETMNPDNAAAMFFGVEKYPFNEFAKLVAYVHMKFSYINEMIQDGPLVSTGIVDQVTVERDYYYLLELDGQQNIIGGEWISTSQSNHPDFLWFPSTKPDDATVTSIGLKYKDVASMLKESVACSTSDSSQSPSLPPPPPTSDESCGNDQVGALSCPSGEYCQPWNPTSYQCRKLDAKCGVQETDVDYYGDDIATYQLLLPEQCCDLCFETEGCTAYTFINYNPDGNAYCYLKKGSGQKTKKVGAVSATIVQNGQPVTSQCSTPVWGYCGNPSSGAACCQNGQYCQPWDVNYFQCIQTPSKCSRQFPNVDFYGEDITTVYGIGPGECCDTCAATSGCKAYTYVNDNYPTPACYLKKGSGQQRAHPTAVSGLLN